MADNNIQNDPSQPNQLEAQDIFEVNSSLNFFPNETPRES